MDRSQSISFDLQAKNEVGLPKILHLVSFRHLGLEASEGIDICSGYGEVIHIDTHNDEALGAVSDIDRVIGYRSCETQGLERSIEFFVPCTR